VWRTASACPSVFQFGFLFSPLALRSRPRGACVGSFVVVTVVRSMCSHRPWCMFVLDGHAGVWRASDGTGFLFRCLRVMRRSHDRTVSLWSLFSWRMPRVGRRVVSRRAGNVFAPQAPRSVRSFFEGIVWDMLCAFAVVRFFVVPAFAFGGYAMAPFTARFAVWW
jgi:hypothetical protein